MSSDTHRMLPSERRQQIKQLALERGALRVSDLAQAFEVSEMTIRRDLSALEEAGQLERTFGGAMLSEQASFESSYKIRRKTNRLQKDAIASYAATLIHEGDTVAIDASTTGLALARQLAFRQLTILTNSLDIVQELRGATPKVICTGGWYREAAGSFVGPLSLQSLSNLRVDRAFFSAKGILVPDGYMDSDLDEIAVKRAMLQRAAKITALVDSSKFGKRALGCIATLDEVDLLVTDDALVEQLREQLMTFGLRVQVVEVDKRGAA